MLTEDGMEFAQELLQRRGLLDGPEGYRDRPSGNLYDPVNLETLHITQQCLRATRSTTATSTTWSKTAR